MPRGPSCDPRRLALHSLAGAAWLEIARAFQRYDLEPDPDCELREGELSAFSGTGGVEAALAKQEGWRGLVVREAAGGEEWSGRRQVAGQ